MTATISTILFLCGSAAAAEPTDVIRQAAMECWSVSEADAAKDFAAMVDARVRDGGSTEVRIRSYEPEGAAGRYMSGSLLRALMRCAPYDVPPGLYQFEMTYADPFSNG